MYEFLDYLVRDVMTESPVCVEPQCSLADLVKLFDQHDFNTVPVIGGDGELAGVVSKLDLLRAFEFTEDRMFPPYEEIMQRRVESIVHTEVVTVRPNTPLTKVLSKLVATRNKSFPVVDAHHKVVGIVAREDVMEALRTGTSGEKPVG